MNKNRSKEVSCAYDIVDYNVTEFHFDDKIPEQNFLKKRLEDYFVLSTYEDYDFFIFLLEEDMKIHKMEDFVFYNSTWRYHPYKKDKNGNELTFMERLHNSENPSDYHHSLPASFDGSIIGEDAANLCHPDDTGIQIELNKTDRRIKRIFFFVGDGDSSFSTNIKHCIVRLSNDLMYGQEERNGIDRSFFYKEIEFSNNHPFELCFALVRNNEDEWEYSSERMSFNSIEELVSTYVKDSI